MLPSATDAWHNAMQSLREAVPERTVQNWLLPIEPRSLDAGDGRAALTLAVPNRFCAQYLQSRFQREISTAVRSAVGQATDVVYEVAAPDATTDAGAPDSASAPAPASDSSPRDAHRDPSGRDSTDRDSTDRNASSRTASQGASRRASASGAGSPRPAASHSGDAGPRSRPSPNASASNASASHEASRNGRSRRGAAPNARSGRPSGRPSEASRASASRASDARASTSHASTNAAGAPLKPSYTFAEFIEGDGNRLARSAAVAVAQNPGGTSYNPLLVYGGVGLGKTHLAQAIANHALQQHSAETVLYVSSDRFTSQFVQAVKNHSIPRFSQYYRQADLLIVDDVQFFGGKEKTQEEFFHIFNELHQCGKQIVLCADRPPREIEGIEKRLLSRFQWGLSADIQRPDLETRIAILQRKADHRDLDVDPRVLELLAHRIDSNIRQLEGALNRLAAVAQLQEGTLDIQTARSFLSDQMDETTRVPDPNDIIEQVASFYRLTADDLLSRSRKQAIASARQVAMYLCRELTEQSYASIGSRFGGRDHSTVIHAYGKVEERMDVEPDFRAELDDLRSRLSNRPASMGV